MNHSHSGSPLGQYRTVDAYGAAAGDRVQLVVRITQGALDRIAAARGQIERNEIAAKGESLSRAVRMIDGLRSCLDYERGGEIAVNLAALYDYMMQRLTEANLHNDPRRLDEVAGLLEELRSGWQEISRSPEVRSGTATA